MNVSELKKEWLLEEQTEFLGWDFAHIAGRTADEPLPWDYRALVLELLDPAIMLLDMGTGGGEFLLSLSPTPGMTYATEAYPPNIEQSRSTLAPHGIEVAAVTDDAMLPFPDNRFDLVINRHEAYCAKEVYRILKPGGRFITQQVGSRNNSELSRFLLGDLPELNRPVFDMETAAADLVQAGLTVLERQEHHPLLTFYDVGALVYFCRIIEWEFPGFSVERCLDRLCLLQKRLEREGRIQTQEHRFLLTAYKDKSSAADWV